MLIVGRVTALIRSVDNILLGDNAGPASVKCVGFFARLLYYENSRTLQT